MSQFRKKKVELCGPYVSASITPPNNLHVTRLPRVSSPHVKALCANNFKFAPSFTGLMTSVFTTYVNKWIPIYSFREVRENCTQKMEFLRFSNETQRSTSHKFSFENPHPHKAFFSFKRVVPKRDVFVVYRSLESP